MTVFLTICGCMVLATLALLAWPLLRAPSVEEKRKGKGRFVTIAIIVLGVPAIAAGLYAKFSTWRWDGQIPTTQATGQPDVNQMVQQLAQRLKNNPQDADGWLMLGRSYVQMGQAPAAVDAYQQAYDLTGGKNIEAVTGLAEALALNDETSLAGKAGQLIEEALVLQPTSPKALWYGGLSALRAEKLDLARDRFKTLLAQNPPERVRAVLEREVQDLEQQIAGGGAQRATNKQQRKIRVSVTLGAALKQQLSEPMTLFVLARIPGRGGPPLAVVRRSSLDLPLEVELTEADAMMPTMTLAGAPQVEVVARLSKSGQPMERSGDYAGAALYSFAEQGMQGAVKIEIDRAVP